MARGDSLAMAAMLAVVSGCAVSEAPPEGPFLLTDAHNFDYSASLTIEVAPIPAQEEFVASWTDLGTDLMGRPMDPMTGVRRANLVELAGLNQAEVVAAIATDTLRAEDITLFVSCETSTASCALSEFTFLGPPIDLTPRTEVGSGTWLLVLEGLNDLGRDEFRKLLFLEPTVGAADQIAFQDSSSLMVLDPDLEGGERLEVPIGEPALEIDWSALTVDGLGAPLALHTLDLLTVLRTDQTPSELEGRFAELELIATGLWSLPLEQTTSVFLDEADGTEPFPGVDTESTWLVVLRCGTCTNPVPRVLSVLEPWAPPAP